MQLTIISNFGLSRSKIHHIPFRPTKLTKGKRIDYPMLFGFAHRCFVGCTYACTVHQGWWYPSFRRETASDASIAILRGGKIRVERQIERKRERVQNFSGRLAIVKMERDDECTATYVRSRALHVNEGLVRCLYCALSLERVGCERLEIGSTPGSSSAWQQVCGSTDRLSSHLLDGCSTWFLNDGKSDCFTNFLPAVCYYATQTGSILVGRDLDEMPILLWRIDPTCS